MILDQLEALADSSFDPQLGPADPPKGLVELVGAVILPAGSSGEVGGSEAGEKESQEEVEDLGVGRDVKSKDETSGNTTSYYG